MTEGPKAPLFPQSPKTPWAYPVLAPLSKCYPGSPGQIIYVLLTRAPLYIEEQAPFPFDLHVLGTPPAFVLSQDQTLQFNLRPENPILV